MQIHTHTHTHINLPVDQRWSSGTGSAGSRTKGNAEPEQGTSWEGQQMGVEVVVTSSSLGFDSDQYVM